MRTRTSETVVNYVILVLFCLFALLPLVILVQAAMGHDAGAPGGLVNFGQAWTQGHFGRSMLASITVSLLVVIIATVASIMTGYAFGTMRFRGSTVMFYVFILGMMMPSEAIIVPLYFDMRTVGLTDTIWSVVAPQTAQSIAFGTFWLRTYFQSADRSVVEAARIDGLNSWQTLWRIVAPLGRSSILTLLVLEFMWTWNEFLIPLVMTTKDSLRTVPLGLAFFQGQYTQGFTLLAAGSVIISLPVVIAYVILQKYFIAGITEGAVK
ncbi:carbohydrate ABC transporter permease [Cutibacterium sp. V947]|uniref:carbohydrate ABC transporter permease n=1 Tax=unclassified Cutibacterium TaxID=2649671 RepID=UPI003EDF11CA